MARRASSEEQKKAVGRRMKQAARAAGLTSEMLGELLGIAGASVRAYWIGNAEPSYERTQRYAEITGVSAQWLLTGQQAPPVSQDTESEERAREIALDVLTVWADTFAAGGSMQAALDAMGMLPEELSLSQVARLSEVEEAIRAELASFSGGDWSRLSDEEKRSVLQRLMDALP